MEEILKYWKEYSEMIDESNKEYFKNLGPGYAPIVCNRKCFEGFMDWLITKKYKL